MKNHRQLLSLLCLLSLSAPALAHSPNTSDAQLKTFHQQSVVVDTHVDTVLRMLDKGVKLGVNSAGHLDIPKMKKGGLDVVFFSVWVDPQYGQESKARADFLIQTIKKQVADNPKDIEMAYSKTDVDRIVKAGKIAALLGLEGTHPLLGKLENLDHFYDQGVRYVGLTWSVDTAFAGSSGGKAQGYGLTDLGKKLVRRLEKLGVLIDLSHASNQTFWDVMSMVHSPVIASHSSARALRNHPRNLSDAMLRVLAKNGGVTGINYYPEFITQGRRATLSDVVDHIEHVIKVAGAEHVGLGSDYDGIGSTPVGLEDASSYFAITQELKRRGHSPETIRKVLGNNFLRVMGEVLK